MSTPVTPVNFTPFAGASIRRDASTSSGAGNPRPDAAPAADVRSPASQGGFRPLRREASAAGGDDAQTRFGTAPPGAGAGTGNEPAGRIRRSLLTDGERAQLQRLRARDRQVRAHEAAHAAAGGSYAGAPGYSYQRGPDGVQYAVGGAVSIDVSPVPGDPAATIVKMRIVRAAALAPAQPSQADRQIATRASREITRAQAELAREGGDGRAPAGASTRSALGARAVGDGEGARSDAAAPQVDARIERALGTYRSIADLTR